MLTIRQLLEFDHLRLRLLAGARGAGNRVGWAQVTDLRDPSPWVEGGELLVMRAGSLPRVAGAQASCVERLAELGVAGLAIAAGGESEAPPTRSMLKAADRVGLPLLTLGATPFSALAEAIQSGSLEYQYHRLATTVRVYGTLGELARTGPDLQTVFERLGSIIGCELSAATPFGAPLFPALPPHVEVPVDELAAAVRRRDAETPVRLHLREDEAEICLVPITARQHPLGVLIATARPGSERNDMMLRHAATVVSLLAAEVLAERTTARRDGGERLNRMLAAAEAGETIRLADLFPGGPHARCCYAAIALAGDGDEAPGWDEVHHRLRERGVAHVMSHRGDRGRIVAQLPDALDADALVDVLASALPGSTFGVSSVLPSDALLRHARREARWVLQRGLADERSPQTYERITMPTWLSLDHSGLGIMVDSILGPLVAHDAETGSELVKTLTVLLEEGRSWKAASTRLYVHRQTLLQRSKRIEQLTGRRLSSTADVTDFWLALRARQVLLRSDAAGQDPAAAAAR